MSNNSNIVHKFWDRLDDSPFVMIGATDQAAHHEPMTAHFDRAIPNRIYIYLADDNRLCEALEEGKSDVSVQFVSKNHDFFACLHGTLSRVKDPSMIDRFWSKKVEAWFEGGRQDPKLAMVEVDLGSGEMWEAHVPLAGKLEMMFGGDIDKDTLEQNHAEVAL